MNNLLDDSLVALLLLASAAYLLASLGPRSLRKRFLQLLSNLLQKAPSSLGLKGLSQRLAGAAALKASGACGGCDNCGSEQTQSEGSTPSEIKVPVGKIGRRA